MSNDRPPLDDLDLSSVLDGEADQDVLSRLEGDAEATARLAQLREASTALAAAGVPDLSDAQVDSMIATALAATDANDGDDDGADPEVQPEVVPVPLSRHRGGVPAWAVAAVVILLVGVGLTLVWLGRDDSDADMAFEEIGASLSVDDSSAASGDQEAAGSGAVANNTEEMADSAAEMAPEATDRGGDGESAASTTVAGAEPGSESDAAPTVVYLGKFADADELRVRLAETFPTEDVGPMPDTGVSDHLGAAFRCLGKLDGMFGTNDDVNALGIAIIAGDAAVVYDLPYVTDEGRNTTIVIAVDEVSCSPVLSFQR